MSPVETFQRTIFLTVVSLVRGRTVVFKLTPGKIVCLRTLNHGRTTFMITTGVILCRGSLHGAQVS